MESNFLKSSEFRVGLGTFIIVWVLLLFTVDFLLKEHSLNATIATALIGFASGLVSAGLFTKSKK